MTIADDVAQVQQDLDQLTLTLNGGGSSGGSSPPSTSAADWQAIDSTLSALGQNSLISNLNDYAVLMNAIRALRIKWDGANHILAHGLATDMTTLKVDAAATPAAAPTPAAVVVTTPAATSPAATSPAATAPGQFSTGQTATVGVVGVLVGLGGGYLLWKGPTRQRNPRRRHRAKSEEAEQ